MKVVTVIHVGLWCAGVCLGGACSSDGDGKAGSDGTGAVAETNGGRASGGTAGRASGGNAGAGEAGSGGAGSAGRPEGGMGGGGQGGACDEEVTNDLIQRTLTEYCQDRECPDTLDEARESVRECRVESQYSEEKTGCGYTVVSFYTDNSGRSFVFDGIELVGAFFFDDVAEPPCDTVGEAGGVYPPDCPEAESCRICDNEDGSAGEGPFCDMGGAGAGGQGGQGGQGGSGNP